ncbi:hypothetical protein PVK06_036087 [Gossypium arboreum]|uniref:Uncharacterized protein n=1 Tax=Gossypium arboreum TaxID=29729 RepID=A0ABR0NJH5_GOSAR|nr:hypothetical protein PVK06_036087 [Gossypium arboreum]
MQCQIYGKLVHVAWRCFYRYDVDGDEVSNSGAHSNFGAGHTPSSVTGSGASAYMCFTPGMAPPSYSGLSSHFGPQFTSGSASYIFGMNIGRAAVVRTTQATPSVVAGPVWYPDSGATTHITHDSTQFNSSHYHSSSYGSVSSPSLVVQVVSNTDDRLSSQVDVSFCHTESLRYADAVSPTRNSDSLPSTPQASNSSLSPQPVVGNAHPMVTRSKVGFSNRKHMWLRSVLSFRQIYMKL